MSEITNPGVSENVVRQTSLAEAIAGNLTASRQGEKAVEAPQKAEPERTAVDTPREPGPREVRDVTQLDSAEVEAVDEGTPEARTEETSEDSERYTIDDFAAAAEIDADSLLDRLDVEVKQDGGNKRISLRDVLRGFQYEAANTRRATALADERRQVEVRTTEIKQMHEQAEAVVRAQWGDVDAEEQALTAQYHAMPWEQLRSQGPGVRADAEAEFTRRRQDIADRRSKLTNAYTQVQQERQGLAERQQAEEMPRQREKLLDLVPEWQDEVRAKREGQEITEFAAKRYGFDPEHLAGVADARMVHALRDLWMYHQQADGVPIAAKKVAKAPRAVKPGTRTGKQDASERKRREMRGRLKSSGKRGDLAAMVLENLRGH